MIIYDQTRSYILEGTSSTGRPRVHAKEVQGNLIMKACLKLMKELDRCQVPWIMEHPMGSLAWHLPELRALLSRGVAYEGLFDWCRFQCTWRKRTRLRGRTPFLPQLNRLCLGGHDHSILMGAAGGKHGQTRVTRVAGEYHKSFCDLIAMLMNEYCGGSVEGV